MRVLKKRNVTILNVSAMPHTRSIAVAQGYTCYSNGTFIAIPILSRNSNTMHVRIIESNTEPDVPFNVHDRELLLEHADYGCVSLWCVTPERAYPFVFRSRMLKGVLRCMQLIYCSDLSEFVRFAGPIGAFLTRKMQFLVMLDANGPLQGLVGRYFPDKMIKYFSGPEPPRLGDLAYTETAMFGI
jgi:hypothetical protein